MVASEDGKVLHARQMTLYYHILIVVVLTILERLHIHVSGVVQHAWVYKLWGRFNEISAKIYTAGLIINPNTPKYRHDDNSVSCKLLGRISSL